ncbi:MAG: homoserine O-succinyltransferase [Deltaproteobacteria bacterium]|nr:homoserine O-succinyltransferase [Deltaproteobacteria bacterium]
MPLVEHSKLPTFARLREQGHLVLSLEQALRQDIRELHIGFLNMMPDGALEATERQFIRLVGGCNRIAQVFVYPFSLPGLPREQRALDYIHRYYSRFDELKAQGLDALIITGANVENPVLEEEPFWTPLIDVISWAQGNVASVLCSCLATHAVLKHFHGIKRKPLPDKRWGVYSHRISQPNHPLLREINTRFDAPHSRHNDISRADLEEAGVIVLAEGPDGGVHIAVSPDQACVVYLQGHPEYDVNSLLKEYKREVSRFAAGERDVPPSFPEHYFSPEASRLAEDFVEGVVLARSAGRPTNVFPEELIEPELDNTWGDTAKAIVNNWLGMVYQLTNLDRKMQFKPNVDARDPLGLVRRTPRMVTSTKEDML